MLIFAIVSITLALVLYSLGVWAERIKKVLLPWHVLVFWGGLVFDTAGTLAMGTLGEAGFSVSLHSISGLLAIVLMLAHAIWASLVILRGSEAAKAGFHKFSLFVWILWLLPYFSGAMAGMGN